MAFWRWWGLKIKPTKRAQGWLASELARPLERENLSGVVEAACMSERLIPAPEPERDGKA